MHIILLIFLLYGCAMPVPLMYVNYARTGFDTVSMINDTKTTTDYVVSEIIKEDCKTVYLFENDGVYCKKTLAQLLAEYIDELKK